MSAKQPSDTKLSPAKLRMVSDERGAVLALVALLLVVFLGLAALAIDLGLLYVARGEAQRAADAAAHAGAGYLMTNPGAPDPEIKQEAIRVGLENLVRGEPGNITEDDIEILDDWKVRAHVHRTQERGNPVSTLLARVLGFDMVSVSASAAAQLWPADVTECVLPFAIPDRWCLSGADGAPCPNDYSDGLDPSQGWEDGHWYRPWSNPLTINGSDYWTGYSDKQFGNALNIRPSSPQDALQPGWFFPFRIPGHQGASDYRKAIDDCVTGDRIWGVGDVLYTENGRMEGPTQQGFEGGGGVDGLLTRYPDARWDPSCNQGVGCAVGDPDDIAGRTRPVVLFDPSNPPEIGNNPFEVVGFAAVFVEGPDDDGNIIVYFDQLTGAKAATSPPAGGGPMPQIKILRIVE